MRLCDEFGLCGGKRWVAKWVKERCGLDWWVEEKRRWISGKSEEVDGLV